MTEDQASRVYDVLVRECGFHDDDLTKLAFVQYVTGPPGWPKEWRFGGSLGSGGKFRIDGQGKQWRIDCYPEDATSARKSLIFRVNDILGHIEAGRSL